MPSLSGRKDSPESFAVEEAISRVRDVEDDVSDELARLEKEILA